MWGASAVPRRSGDLLDPLVLRDVHPLEGDRPHLAAELRVLERRELTVQETPEPELAYLFKHVITQETAYSLLPFAQRRALHRTGVAGWIERREGIDLAPYYPLLAHHWGRAEDRAKAIDYLELAGEQALRQSAYQEAVGFLTEALRLARHGGGGAGDRSRRARWERAGGGRAPGPGAADGEPGARGAGPGAPGPAGPRHPPGLVAGLAGQVLRQALHRAWPARFVGRAAAPAPNRDPAPASTWSEPATCSSDLARATTSIEPIGPWGM